MKLSLGGLAVERGVGYETCGVGSYGRNVDNECGR